MFVVLSNDEVSICNAKFFVVLHTFEFTYMKYPYLMLSFFSGLSVHSCVCAFSSICKSVSIVLSNSEVVVVYVFTYT